MLKLYTSNKLFKSEEVIENNDTFFDWYSKQYVFTDIDKSFMFKYDGAFFKKSSNSNLITTKYGDAYLNNLSTGLKTLLNLCHITDEYRAVDVTEAGENILFDIFKIADKNNISVILRHLYVPNFEKFSISVDDCKIVQNNYELFSALMERGAYCES